MNTCRYSILHNGSVLRKHDCMDADGRITSGTVIENVVAFFSVLSDNFSNTPAMPMFFGARTNRRVFLCPPIF